MDVLLHADHLDPIYSPKVCYIILTLVVIYLGQLLESSYLKSRREQLTNKQRNIYYQELAKQHLVMERQQLHEQLEVVQSIEELQKNNESLMEQLKTNGQDEDDLEAEISDSWSDSDHDEFKMSSVASSTDRKCDQLEQEIEEAQEDLSKANLMKDELLTLSSAMEESLPLQEASSSSCNQEALEQSIVELSNRIQQLELENCQLKKQIKQHSSLGPVVDQKTNLNPEVVEYIKKYKDELTLDFLREAHETLGKLKETLGDRNFIEYIEELKTTSKSSADQLAILQARKKEAETKLDLLRRRYEEELCSFNQARIDHLMRNSGGKEYLDQLREKNKVKEELIRDLRSTIEAKRKELEVWQTRFRAAESQCDAFRNEARKAQELRYRLEAELKMKDRGDQSFLRREMSPSSSSIHNSIPPPPDVDVPSLDEMLRAADPNQHKLMDMPPLPDMDVPLNEIYRIANSSDDIFQM